MLAKVINDITTYENCIDTECSINIDEYKAVAKSLVGLKFVDRHGKTHTIMNYDTFHRVFVDEYYCVFSKCDITYTDDDDILYKIRYKDIESFKKYESMEDYNKHENNKLYDDDWKYLTIAKQRGLI